MPAPSALPRGASITTWSLVALVGGIALGAIGHLVDAPLFLLLTTVVAPFGTLFVNALQVLAIPFVVLTLLAAIAGGRDTESIGRLSVRALLLFVTMLVVAALFSLAVSPPVIALYSVDSETVARLQASTPVPDAARAAAEAGAFSSRDLVESLVPRNLVEAALRGEILPLLMFTLLFGFAVTRLPAPQRAPLAALFDSLAAAMLTCIRWVLVISPLGVFALIYPAALEVGAGAAGVILSFIVVPCIVMVLFGALLYPVTALLGRTTIRAFARAAAPAQLVALTTRSSIAALPALVQGGRVLRLPETALSFVLPFCVALFKINRPLSGIARLLILAHVYGVPLTPATIAVYIATIMLMSFATAGVPATPFNALPAYLAAGIPIEGFIISEAVDVVPDMLKTWVNVTGDMSVATLLSRSERAAVPAAGVAVPAAESDVA
jgi:proton glutamate symport protein